MFRVIKQPYQPKNPYSVVSKSHSSELSDLSNALFCLKEYSHVDGIGYMFGEGDGLVGVDLDNCRDPFTGKIREEYLFWVKKLGSYAEISPSGTGVKIWVKGTVSDIYFASTEATGFRILNYAGGEIEIYWRGQFFTVTTQTIEGFHYNYIRNAQEDLDVICEFSLSSTDRNFKYYPFPEDQLEEDKELSLLKDFLDDVELAYTDESDIQLNALTETIIYSPTNDVRTLSVPKDPFGKTHCKNCGRETDELELCPVCYAAGSPEEKVEDAVEEYLSQYPGDKVERQHEITIGSYRPKPDIVLLDVKDNIIVIVECKREGIEYNGIEQLKSYLSARDTQFGIFANSIEPDNWKFYENLRKHRFEEISRSQFETEIAKAQHTESIREAINRLDKERTDLRSQLELDRIFSKSINDSKEKQRKELAELEHKIELSRKEENALKQTNDSLKISNKALKSNSEVLESLKLKEARDNLNSEIRSLSENKERLENTIETMRKQSKTMRKHIIDRTIEVSDDKERLENTIETMRLQSKTMRQQCTDLSIKVNELKKKKSAFERKRNKLKSEIRFEGEKLKKETTHREKVKAGREYLEKITEDLDMQIAHKKTLIQDLNRLAKIDELEKANSHESIIGKLENEFDQLRNISSEIEGKQQIAQENQQKHATVERKRVEINQKKQQLVQISQERETIVKQLRRVVKQLKTANPEQWQQIEGHRKQLVEDLRAVGQKHANLFTEIQKLQEDESNLEHEIDEKEHGSLCLDKLPTYLRIQEEIDKLKEEKHQLEAGIGHLVFRTHTDIKLKFTVQKSKEN